MTLVRDADARRTRTPNALMTTLATPTQGGTGAVAVWRVDMPAGRRGPLHAIDAEQVWSFLDGDATIELGGRVLEAAAGDTVVMAADVPRRVTTEGGFVAVVAAAAGGRVYNPDGVGDGCEMAPKGTDRIVPPWAA
ncbi:cupin [Actinomadura miaoliensis]|uniref:Cupin domain-containing protein n=1 Tax=Actinomadura miaoliensis TaxID=430685 RepID=A0ABP7WBL1_9ACTN